MIRTGLGVMLRDTRCRKRQLQNLDFMIMCCFFLIDTTTTTKPFVPSIWGRLHEPKENFLIDIQLK